MRANMSAERAETVLKSERKTENEIDKIESETVTKDTDTCTIDTTTQDEPKTEQTGQTESRSDVYDRGQWSNKTEFYLAYIAISLFSNVSILPRVIMWNGGIVALIPHIIFIILFTIPLVLMQASLGQFSSLGYISVYNICPLLKGLGYTTLLWNLFTMVSLTVSILYPLMFFVNGFIYGSAALRPWETCNNRWNSEKCMEFIRGNSDTLINQTFTAIGEGVSTSGAEYFRKKFLNYKSSLEGVGEIVWPLFGGLAVLWIIICICNLRGVRVIGKLMYITVTVPILLFLVILIRAAMLPNAGFGFRILFTPQWEYLQHLSFWFNGAITSFISSSPGFGLIQTLASYNRFTNNIKVDILIITTISIILYLIPCMGVYALIGYGMGLMQIPSDEFLFDHFIRNEFVFIGFNDILKNIPKKLLWASLFFAAIFIIKINYFILQIDAAITSVLDEFRKLRKYRILILCGLCAFMFLITIPFVTQSGYDLYIVIDILRCIQNELVLALLQIIFIILFYGLRRFIADLEFMINGKFGLYWFVCWGFLIPIILVCLSIHHISMAYNLIPFANEKFGLWTFILGSFKTFLTILLIPAYIVYKLFLLKSPILVSLRNLIRPKNWYPAKEIDYVKYLKKFYNYDCTEQNDIVLADRE